VVILVSSDFGEYRKIFSKITKAGEESGEHIWYFLSENVKDSLYENFDANRTKIFNWEEYEFFLKETKRFNADILVPVLQNEILSYIEKGEDRFRLVFETSSKVMNYVENFEDFFIYEKNFESAISKIPINILHVCSYVENDIISFKSKMKTIEFLKEIIHSHDKLIYLSRKGRVFLDMEAVFYLFEENFSDLRN